jgi:hypothetical protein
MADFLGAEPITVEKTFHSRDNRSANHAIARPGERLPYGVAYIVVPNGDQGTTGAAAQGSLIISLQFEPFSTQPPKQAGKTALAQGKTSGEELLGMWAGTWSATRSGKQKGQDFMLEIKQIDFANNRANIYYKWSATTSDATGETNFIATFIPADKLEWNTKNGYYYQFELKDGKLWGTKTHGKTKQTIIMERKKE